MEAGSGVPQSCFSPAALMPFPAAAGRGVRIAVIDSGVHAGHPHIFAKTSGVLLGESNENEFNHDPAAWSDELGHGTAVMAAIQEKAPEAEYWAIKLFGKSLRATSRRLIRAIQWAINHQVNVINLSLGTQNPEHRSEFDSIIQQASAAGILLVCARTEGNEPILPGTLDGVFPVEVDWMLPRHSYRIAEAGGSACYFASGFPRPLPGISPVRNLSGISFAVANMTGLVARAWEHTSSLAERPSLKQIEAALRAETMRVQA